MRLLDRRLARHGRVSVRYLVLAVVVEVARVGLLIVQALLLARVIAAVFLRQSGIDALEVEIAALVVVFAARALLGWLSQLIAHRVSATVRSSLRMLMLRQAGRLGSSWLTGVRSGELATLVLRGIDALDGYFARYLPQLVLAALLPFTVVLCLLGTDWPSALLVTLTVPLIPVFMVLVGSSTRSRVGAQWAALQRSAHHFMDVVAGLGTLVIFGRSRAQLDTIHRLSEQQRRTGKAALRIAFLSALVLELLATLSVAIVAVVVSLRVLYGTLDFETALFVLVLVPEAYHPMRQLASHYHASAEGLAAADTVFEMVESAEQAPEPGTIPAPDPRTEPITLEAVTVHRPGRADPVIHELSLRIEPGRFTAVVAPTGTGKSTLLGLLTRAVRPDGGTVRIGETDLRRIQLDGPSGWRSRFGWLPQSPELFAGTVAENIALAEPNAGSAAIEQAARTAAVDLPLSTQVGERGRELSSGQRRRVALARALLPEPGLVLLDEPTESVDPETEAVVFEALRHGLVGRTVVVVTHRPALLQLCHHVVQLDRAFVRSGAEVGV